MATNVARALKPIAVLDPEGAPHRLGSLWARRPVVLAFIRHFG